MRRVIHGKSKGGVFEAVFDTTKAGITDSNTLSIPLLININRNVLIDWGDGSILQSNITSHTYLTAGIYTVKVYTLGCAIRYNNSGDKAKILEIKSFGNVYLIRNGFQGCINLRLDNVTDTPQFEPTDSFVYFLFEKCTSLVTINRLNEWDLSKVFNTLSLFQNCFNFNQEININIPNSASLANMFANCTALNSPITINAPKCTTVQSMFQSCTNLNKNITLITSSVLTSLQAMFISASSFNSTLVISNTLGVKVMTDMFQNAHSYNQSIIFSPMPNLTNIDQMFRSASGINQSSIGNWDISNVTNMQRFMFGKTPATLSPSTLDAIIIGWAAQSVKPNQNPMFGTAKRTTASDAAYVILTSAPNNWIFSYGGVV